MKIYDFAIQMEADGEVYYRKLADIAAHPGLTAIFTHLADSEHKHLEIIKEMKRERYILQEVSALDREKNLFTFLKKEPVSLVFPEDEVKAYEEALKIEEKSRDFYEEKAEEMVSPEAAAAFRRLAQEEQSHVLIIQNVINFVYKPQQWVESAEFGTSDDEE